MKVLIVDDSETLRTQLRRDLEQGGFSVLEAFDGVNGLEVLEKNSDVNLIICDVNMPRLDGLSMCQKVKEQDRFQSLPILMMTTESSAEMKAQGKSVGVLAWVTKPYHADKLITAVRRICS